MDLIIIDASVAIKWVVDEPGSIEAVALRGKFAFAAPDLLIAECANILWKKTARGELSADEALLAARLLQRSDVRLSGMSGLMVRATELAILLGHPAYDCLYLAAAEAFGCRFVTADTRFLRIIEKASDSSLKALCFDLMQSGAGLG